MKDKMTMMAFGVAVIFLAIGFITHFTENSIVFIPRTWHLLAQTVLIATILCKMGDKATG